MIAFQCGCGKRFSVPEQYAGKRAKCKQCGQTLQVPALAPAAPEPEPTIDFAAMEAMEQSGRVIEAAPAPVYQEQYAPAAAPPPLSACPACGQAMGAAAVVCIQCGHNRRTGSRGVTAVSSSAPTARGARQAVPRFNLASWVLLPLAGYVALCCYVQKAQMGETYGLSSIVGYVSGGVLVSGLLAYVVFRSAGRSKNIASLTFAGMLTICAIASFNTYTRHVNTAGEKQVRDQFVAEFDARKTAAEQAARTLQAMGPPETITSREDLNRRMALLDDVLAKYKALFALATDLPTDLRRRLTAAGVGEARIDTILSRERKDMELAQKLARRTLDMLDVIHEQYAYLEQNWGHWSVAGAGKEVRLDTDTRVREFNSIRQRFLAAAREVLSLVKESGTPVPPDMVLPPN